MTTPSPLISLMKALCFAFLTLLLPVESVTAQRAAVDVMLVLDKSGSMSQQVPGLAMTKWTVLQESVQAFLESYRSWGEDLDRVGVTYFDHTRSDFPPGGMVNFNPPMNPLPLTGPGSIQQDMMSRSPSGMTCMGGGILAGYLAFDASHPNRNMIIFTDGLQNMEPMVSQAQLSDMVINDYNVRPDGTGFPAPPLDLKNPTLDFRTYTVAIGDNAVTGLLQDIAMAPIDTGYDGESFSLNSMINLPMELDAIFTQMFVESLAQFSPQLVDVKRIAGNTATSFIVNSTADKLLIRVVADPVAMSQARIRIEKDGRDFSRYIRPGGSTYKTLFLDSAMIRQFNVSLAGSWSVTVSGSSAQFQVSCLVNDESLNATASTGNREYAPGDTVSLEAMLKFSDSPVTDATSVSVLVAKPGEDTNDLFARAGSVDPGADFPVENGADPGQLKYEALIAFNNAFVTSLRPVHDTISLSHVSNGKYTATFSETEASGLYRFVFRIRGNNPQTGPYERFILRSAIIDFGAPDEAKSVFSVVTISDRAHFQLSPKNKFGHMIGPNRLTQVRLAIDGKLIKLTDKLDGTYEAPVPERSFFNPDPNVTVDIKGSEFYDDKFSSIEGNDLTFWDKYHLWFLFLILIILVLIIFIAKKK